VIAKLETHDIAREVAGYAAARARELRKHGFAAHSRLLTRRDGHAVLAVNLAQGDETAVSLAFSPGKGTVLVAASIVDGEGDLIEDFGDHSFSSHAAAVRGARDLADKALENLEGALLQPA